MSALTKVTSPPNIKEPTKFLVDIMIVATVIGFTFLLENLAIAQGWMPFAEEIRGAFSVLAGACAAVGVVHTRSGTLADLGFKRPQSWAKVPFQVAVIVFAFVVGETLAPLLVSTFISLPEPDFSRYDSIAGNLGGAIAMALILPLTASIPEEIIYRGFLMGRLSKIFGSGRDGTVATVLVQALIFGSIHFQWGIGGMLMTFIMGIVWGSAYLLCGRNLWVVILSHSTGHLLFVLQLYLTVPIIV